MWYKCTGEQSRRRRKQCCLENRRQWNGDPKSPLSCPPPSAFNRRVHLCHFQWISTGRECSCSWRRRHVAKFIGGRRSSKQRWRTKSKIIVVLIVTENKSQSDMQPDVLLCMCSRDCEFYSVQCIWMSLAYSVSSFRKQNPMCYVQWISTIILYQCGCGWEFRLLCITMQRQDRFLRIEMYC